MKFSTCLCVIAYSAMTVVSGPTALQAEGHEQLFAGVRGWHVLIDSDTCIGRRQNGGTGAAEDFEPYVAPSGNWELKLPNTTSRTSGDVNVTLEIDGTTFRDTGVILGSEIHLVFDLRMRHAFRDGYWVTFTVDGHVWERSLYGVTATLLKLEECWNEVSGYDADVSNRAPARAFE
ncbi:hypothetical protein [Candidatus Rhodobacter oscarellae]|uniref:hypothetical protein n=1 Tax=Candidatus Rhodobacter oscarellae TaxID=1675527 RepID=UPI000AE146F4|nr:hypothetical protein [Candidatus Rhodobacter lobularis]